MTTQETPAPVEAPVEDVATAPVPEEPKGLRAQNDALRAENRQLKAEKKDDVLKGLGLRADTGLGLVLTEQFERGDIALDQIATTAVDKYGHTVPEVQPPAHPAQAQIQQGYQALDGVAPAAGSIAPPTQSELLAKAEAEGNTDASIAMKSAQIGQMLRPNS
jgi:hypothetical protein